MAPAVKKKLPAFIKEYSWTPCGTSVRSLGASKVPPTFGFDDFQSCIEMHRVPNVLYDIVGDLRIPAEDAMCVRHIVFLGVLASEKFSPSLGGR